MMPDDLGSLRPYMKRYFIFTLIAVAFLPRAPIWGRPISPAQDVAKPPQTDDPSAAAEDCDSSQNQRDMNACFAREANAADKLLKNLLNELEASLGVQQLKTLQETQLKWTEYRAMHCKWQAAFFDGGTIQPTIFSGCISNVTWNRIDELKTNLCEGSGMTGPCE